MIGDGGPPTYVLKRHPRAMKWKGAQFNSLACSPEERKFVLTRGTGAPVGDMVFTEFKRKTGTATTPWGIASIRSKSLFGTKFEVSRSGIPVANIAYNLARSKMRLDLVNGQTMTFHRTKLLWRMEAETDLGTASINLDGTIAPTGERVWELDRKTSKELYKDSMAQRPEQVGLFQMPGDASARHESFEEPFHLQWSISLPSALEKNDQLATSIVVLLGYKFLLLEVP